MGLAYFFFMMMFFGVIWGAIFAWNDKVGYVLFLLLAVAGFVMYLLAASGAAGGDTSVDVVRIIVGAAGFGFGYAGGASGYRQAFENNDRIHVT